MNCHGNERTVGRTKDGSASCCGGGNGTRRYVWIIILLLGGIILAFGVVKGTSAGWLEDLFRKTPVETAKAAGVVETADEVRIPLRALDSGKAIFLKADLAGKEIHYFVVKSNDGVYRAAYDACDVCFRMNRGYRQEGDLVVCNNCGQSFPSAKVNEVKGGCNPSPLARTVDGDSLVIRKADLAAGGPYFVRKRS